MCLAVARACASNSSWASVSATDGWALLRMLPSEKLQEWGVAATIEPPSGGIDVNLLLEQLSVHTRTRIVIVRGVVLSQLRQEYAPRHWRQVAHVVCWGLTRWDSLTREGPIPGPGCVVAHYEDVPSYVAVLMSSDWHGLLMEAQEAFGVKDAAHLSTALFAMDSLEPLNDGREMDVVLRDCGYRVALKRLH
jgi:hypothetical protein